MQMKRLMITVDEETEEILTKHKVWGKPFSSTIRLAVKRWDENRQRAPSAQQSVNTYRPPVFEEPTVNLD